MQKTISILVPVYNEESCILPLYVELQKYLPKDRYDFKILFINDGSSDGTQEILKSLSKKDSSITVIEFSRNFGKEAATSAGIHAATGDAVIMIDADLQHPPTLIPEFIARWEEGAEVVVGVRTRNRGATFLNGLGSRAFYKIMDLISDANMVSGETDFRLIDGTVATAFKDFSERRRLTRSLINWLGFKKEYIEFEAPERANGKAKFSTVKLIHLALYSFVSHSLLPLRLAGYLGLLITFSSFVGGSLVFVDRYIFDDAWNWGITGPVQVAIINVFLIGIVLMALGLIALYIENIHDEAAGRPLYVVRKRK